MSGDRWQNRPDLVKRYRAMAQLRDAGWSYPDLADAFQTPRGHVCRCVAVYAREFGRCRDRQPLRSLAHCARRRRELERRISAAMFDLRMVLSRESEIQNSPDEDFAL